MRHLYEQRCWTQVMHASADAAFLCASVFRDSSWPFPSGCPEVLALKFLPVPYWQKCWWRVAFRYPSPSVCTLRCLVKVNQKAVKVKQLASPPHTSNPSGRMCSENRPEEVYSVAQCQTVGANTWQTNGGHDIVWSRAPRQSWDANIT